MDKREDREKERRGRQEPAFTSCGSLGKLLGTFEPQFPHLHNGLIRSSFKGKCDEAKVDPPRVALSLPFPLAVPVSSREKGRL